MLHRNNRLRILFASFGFLVVLGCWRTMLLRHFLPKLLQLFQSLFVVERWLIPIFPHMDDLFGWPCSNRWSRTFTPWSGDFELVMFFRLCTYWSHLSRVQPLDTFSDTLRKILKLLHIRLLEIFKIERVIQITVDRSKPVYSILDKLQFSSVASSHTVRLERILDFWWPWYRIFLWVLRVGLVTLLSTVNLLDHLMVRILDFL